MKNTYLFSLRRVLRSHMTASGTLLVLLIGFLGFNWLSSVFNPQEINHLLLVNRSQEPFEVPLTAVLTGKVSWEQRMDQVGSGPALSGDRVNIINIERDWFLGEFALTDDSGRVLANGEIRPTGRYCGTLVIVLLPNGESQMAFNSLPNITTAASLQEFSGSE